MSSPITTQTGGGMLVKKGGGDLVLASDFSFSGGASISNGNVFIGNGGSSGSFNPGGSTVTVGSGNRLVFNRSDNITVTYQIAGAGEVEQLGTGALVLDAGNTYEGDTFVNAGSITFGGPNSGAVPLGNLQIASGATANFNYSTKTTYSQNILGSGSIDNIGAGTITLNGTIDAGINIPSTPTNGAIETPSGSDSGSSSSNSTATFGIVEIDGTLTEGQTLTAVYTITDSDGFTTGSEVVTWYHDNGDAGQTEIGTGNT